MQQNSQNWFQSFTIRFSHPYTEFWILNMLKSPGAVFVSLRNNNISYFHKLQMFRVLEGKTQEYGFKTFIVKDQNKLYEFCSCRTNKPRLGLVRQTEECMLECTHSSKKKQTNETNRLRSTVGSLQSTDAQTHADMPACLTWPWQEAEPLTGRHSLWQAIHKDPLLYSRLDLQHKHNVSLTANCWTSVRSFHLKSWGVHCK